MVQIIKSLWKLFKTLIGVFKETAEILHTGAEFTHLQTAMFNNTTNIKNKQPLNIFPEYKDLSKVSKEMAIYVYGIRQLNPKMTVEMLLKQHAALTQFVDNIDKYPLKDDYTFDIDKLLKDALIIDNTANQKIGNQR